MAEQPPTPRKMVIFSVSFYMITAIVMIVINKWVLNIVALPLTFLTLQIMLAVVFLHMSNLAGWITLPMIEQDICRKLWMLVFINVLGLAVNTYTLQMVDASFYQIARSLVLPFTIIFSYFVLLETCSQAILVCCAIVCVGFVTGVMGEFHSMRITPLGLFFGIFSSATTAAHTIIIKRSLDVLKGGTLDLVYYNNVLSALVLLPITLVLESRAAYAFFLNSTHAAIPVTVDARGGASELSKFVWGLLVTGFFGFLINIAGFLQVKVTSPVTHCVSSAVRGVLQTMVAVAVFGDIITASRAWGILLVLVGGTAYTLIRSQEISEKTRLTNDLNNKKGIGLERNGGDVENSV